MVICTLPYKPLGLFVSVVIHTIIPYATKAYFLGKGDSLRVRSKLEKPYIFVHFIWEENVYKKLNIKYPNVARSVYSCGLHWT